MDSSESCHGDSTRRATLQDGKAVILCCSSTIYGSALVAVARLIGSVFSSKDTFCPTSMSKGFNRWGEPDQLLEHVGRIAQMSCVRSRLNRVQTCGKSIGRRSLPLWRLVRWSYNAECFCPFVSSPGINQLNPFDMLLWRVTTRACVMFVCFLFTVDPQRFCVQKIRRVLGYVHMSDF